MRPFVIILFMLLLAGCSSSVNELGEYQVIAHVSYKDLHEMPILSFQLTE